MPAHRDEYLRLFGAPTDDGQGAACARSSRRAPSTPTRGGARRARRATPRASAMLGVFCGSATVEDALAGAEARADRRDSWDGLAEGARPLPPRYEVVWNDGAVPEAFLERARRDPGRARLEALARDDRPLLRRRSAGGRPAASRAGPGPRRLRNSRRGDRQRPPARRSAAATGSRTRRASSFTRTPTSSGASFPRTVRRRLAEVARRPGDDGARTFRLFGEAIPTALGQGSPIARSARRDWSLDGPWYHTEDVDACAKRIYPIIAARPSTPGSRSTKGWSCSAIRLRQARAVTGFLSPLGRNLYSRRPGGPGSERMRRMQRPRTRRRPDRVLDLACASWEPASSSA